MANWGEHAHARCRHRYGVVAAAGSWKCCQQGWFRWTYAGYAQRRGQGGFLESVEQDVR